MRCCYQTSSAFPVFVQTKLPTRLTGTLVFRFDSNSCCTSLPAHPVVFNHCFQIVDYVEVFLLRFKKFALPWRAYQCRVKSETPHVCELL